MKNVLNDELRETFALFSPKLSLLLLHSQDLREIGDSFWKMLQNAYQKSKQIFTNMK